MSSAAPTYSVPVTVSYLDRLSLTIFFALALHAIIILGVSFNISQDDEDSLSTMEITLVHNRSEDEPEEADYLAQANQLGGGNIEEKVRDSSPFSNNAPTEEQGIAPDSPRELALPPAPEKNAQQELMTAEKAPRKVESRPQNEPLPVPSKDVTVAQLFERSQEIARLSAKIEQVKKSFAVSPRRTYVRGANAKEFRFASYMDAWRNKVERIGNMNYPEEAVEKNISGSLLLDVAINPDGTLNTVRITRSSGHPVLDKAAVRIVKLAAPYPPLSENILKDTDILHIPRVWVFRSGEGGLIMTP
ncbi:MAG: energy transducer TonB [Proteobacteria bacterium]|jgi:protein TonB|nr:energy transducer TonB [Pseudomonadota bacterium]